MIVCICGSTKFKHQIAEINRQETMKGNIVLAPGVFGHSGDPVTEEDKQRLDKLHLRKIDLAEQVIVVTVDGYIGDSTRSEIRYTKNIGVPIKYVDFKSQPELKSDLSRCPNCGGPADNGHSRSLPPEPYWCSKCDPD